MRQLVDNGKIDLIQSRQMQKAILDYENAYNEAIEQTQTSYAYSKDLTLVIMNSIKYRGPRVVSTLEELKSDQALISALRGKAVMQRVQLETLDSIQEANQALQAKLGAYLAEL